MAALLRRVAASAGVHMYEMEMLGELEYVCHVWIGQALDSLLGGVPEGMDRELIMVDDCSTDGTWAILPSYPRPRGLSCPGDAWRMGA